MLEITKNLTNKKTITSNRKISYIVVHYFGSIGTAKEACNNSRINKRESSAHYYVDDTSIWQSVEDKDSAWHCADVGNGVFKKKCKNHNSIGIELAPRKIDIKKMLATDKDWYFSDKTMSNSIDLIIYLMNKYQINIDNVIRHYDVTTKICPRPFVGNDMNTYYNKTGDQMWSIFKNRIEESNMDIKKIIVNMNGSKTSLNSILYKGENYIKIRDLANAQTDDKLAVDWDEKGQQVLITSK